MKSKFLTLNLSDFWKGLIVAVFTSVLTVVYQSISAGNLVFDFKIVGSTAILAASGYLIKQLTTNSDGKPLSTEVKQPDKTEPDGLK
jgi:hypothetical protein